MTGTRLSFTILLTWFGLLTGLSVSHVIKSDDQCGCNLKAPELTVELDCSGDQEQLLECLQSVRDQSVDHLDHLIIARAKFKTLELSGFDFLSKLKSLVVVECRFEELVLRGLSALSSVQLPSNGLQRVKKEWFTSLPSLQFLSLVDNNLTSLPTNFTHDLATLKMLNVSGNRLATLEPQWFGRSPNLTSLNVSRNQLTQLESSDGGLTLWGSNVPGLGTLDLSWNQVASLFQGAFASQPNLTSLLLDHNELDGLPSEVFEGNPRLEIISLAQNPWRCDSQLLKSLAPWLGHRQPPLSVHDAEDATCASPAERGGESIFLFDEPLCHTCSCVVLSGPLKVDINCTSMNLHELPVKLPRGTKVIDLAQNHIKSLSLPPDSQGWQDVVVLGLDGNEISAPDEVEKVLVSSVFRSLVALKLASNRLVLLPGHLQQQLTQRFHYLYLGNNPWQCDCDTINFALLLQETKKIKDVKDVRCASSCGRPLAGKPIYTLERADLCPQADGINRLLDVLNGIMAFLILTILTKLLIDYWRQKRTGKLPTFFGFT